MIRKRIEHEILLEELLCTLLKQYRHWIIICIVCLVIGLIYMPPTKLSPHKYFVSEMEIANVKDYIESQKALDEITSYNENSVLMSFSPYNQYNLNLEISVSGTTIDSKKWNDCLNLLNNAAFQKKILQLFPEIVDTKFLAEISKTSDITNHSDINEHILQMQFIYPDEKKLQQLSDMVIDQIYTIFEQTTSQIQILKNDVFITINHDLISWQQTQKSRAQTCDSDLSKLWNNLSEYEQLLYEQSSDDSLKQYVIAPSEIQIKEYVEYYCLIIIISLLIYICLELIRLAWSRKVQNIYTLTNELNLNIICEILNIKRVNFFDKIISGVISKMTGNKPITENQLPEYLVHCCEKNTITTIILMGKSIAPKIQMACQSKLTNLNNIKILPYEKNMLLEDRENLILAIQYNEAYYNGILDLKEKCHSENIKLQGVIYFQ